MVTEPPSETCENMRTWKMLMHSITTSPRTNSTLSHPNWRRSSPPRSLTCSAERMTVSLSSRWTSNCNDTQKYERELTSSPHTRDYDVTTKHTKPKPQKRVGKYGNSRIPRDLRLWGFTRDPSVFSEIRKIEDIKWRMFWGALHHLTRNHNWR